MNGNSDRPTVLALIVTYNGAGNIDALLDTCLGDCLAHLPILVIDNASSDATVARLERSDVPRLTVRKLPENIGVAAAYNLGLQHAQALRADWLWIFDQDSVCSKGLLERLLGRARSLENQGARVGALFPCVRSQRFPEHIHFPYDWTGVTLRLSDRARNATADPADPLVPVDSSISSGTLYKVAALANIGGFRADYFIDFVDHECHLRLGQAGWSLWWDPGALLFHNLGALQQGPNGALWSEHPPYRYYYMARNMFEGLRRLGGKSAVSRFLRHDVLNHIRLIFRHGTRPYTAVWYILKGLTHGLRGKFGRL
jgi:rhamnosyltransferase